MATAILRFTQNAVVGTSGEAYLGVVSLPVTVANHDNTGVSNWKFEMVDVPAGSGVAVGTMVDGLTQTTAFTPDVSGCYLVRLTVTDASGHRTRSTPLAFGILEANGCLIPPFGAIDKSLNFGGQTRGWSKYFEEWIQTLSAAFATDLPVVADVDGAVVIEDPASNRIARRLRQKDIDPDFAIASFTTSAAALVRRGDILTGITCAATYVSGPPLTASVADVFANGASGGGAWTLGAPYAAGSKASTISASGTDGVADPSWRATLTATQAGYPDNTMFVTTYWASDVYYGSSAVADIANTDVYTGGALVGSFQSTLQRTRNQVRSFTGANRYDWFLYPNEASYTSGTPTFKDQSGFTFGVVDMGTVSITRNGVVRTYRKIRSVGLLSSDFTVTVT